MIPRYPGPRLPGPARSRLRDRNSAAFKNNGWKVRRAMNKAINREELLDQLYKGIGELMYVGYYHPSHYGWDDTWPERYEEAYKYNHDEARQLLAEAGYGPDNPVKVTVQSYVSPGEAELPQAMEAIANYWAQVGIEVEIEDLDGATVRQRYRSREMQHRVWPNIIIYFPLEYGNLSGFTSTSAAAITTRTTGLTGLLSTGAMPSTTTNGIGLPGNGATGPSITT